MRDITTNKLVFTKAGQELLRAPFARAGHDIRKVNTPEMALDVWVDTLGDDTARIFIDEIDRRAKIDVNKKATQG